MKKIFTIILAAIVFFVAFALLRPAAARPALVAAHDLKAGHILQDNDLTLQSMPSANLPSDVVSNKELVIGQPLRIDRGQGDIIRVSHIGSLVVLMPNERAIAVQLTDASGVSGLLVPGQMVGVIITLPAPNPEGGVSASFSKATIEGLRVLYVDPRFSAAQDANVAPQSTEDAGLAGGYTVNERANSGTVTLAVPISLQSVMYDFSSYNVPSETRVVNALELLAAVNAMSDASITLYLMPGENAVQFSSPGLWLNDMAVSPYTPTPEPTPFPYTPRP